jgi:hypothetical protein
MPVKKTAVTCGNKKKGKLRQSGHILPAIPIPRGLAGHHCRSAQAYYRFGRERHAKQLIGRMAVEV